MSRIAEIGSQVLARAERRVEVSAENIANATKPGFQRRIAFDLPLGEPAAANRSLGLDFKPGALVETGRPLDLALGGAGFFVLQGPDGPIYTRQGAFRREADGRVVDAYARPLQVQGGGDLTVENDAVEILPDGTVLEAGAPVARIEVVAFADPSALRLAADGLSAAPEAEARRVDRPALRQGAYEASNVSTGDEMVAIMEALRRAESGQRLINVYDDLMGRALSAFGQA
ncbi:MAG TPA: flagellar hook basal-body protein [Caulobacteraceae bacterium]|nr:flagellar hook basal-body protein [Caulobacteraceae bacterium]